MTPPRIARRLLHSLLPILDRDVIVADLDEEFSRAIAPLRARFPLSDFTRDTGARTPVLRERVVGNVRPLMLILTAASALVLLVACANIAEAIDVEAGPVLYFPYSQEADTQFNVVIRTSGDPSTLAGPARAALAELHPAAPVATPRTMEEILGTSEAVFQRRSVLTLIGGFAVAALLLAAIGLYGVLAQMVARRRREIGVRLALGAGGGSIALSVAKKVVAALGIGLAAGLAGSVFLGRALESLLFGIRPVDPMTLTSVVASLGIAAAIACLVPIRRAIKVDPVEALRGE